MNLFRICASILLGLSASAAFGEDVSIGKCWLDLHRKDAKGEDEVYSSIWVDGFPKTTKGMEGHCISALGRRPVIGVGQVGDVLSVKNFTHDNRLMYARIDLSKLKDSVLHSMHFAPVIGDHAEMRIRFSANDAVKLYDSEAKWMARGAPDFTLDELLISVEGVPLIGYAYTFTGALKNELTMAYRMISVPDKLDYVKTDKYPTKQALLKYSPAFLRQLILTFIAKSEEFGFSRGYKLATDNCGNELMHVLQDASKAAKQHLKSRQQITQGNINESTAPKRIGAILKRKGLVDMSAKLPDFDTEDGKTIRGYSEEFYRKSNEAYEKRRQRALTGVYTE